MPVLCHYSVLLALLTFFLREKTFDEYPYNPQIYVRIISEKTASNNVNVLRKSFTYHAT